MNHQRWHFIEKMQVELAAVIGLVAMYFFVWPVVAPWDVDGVVLFLPIGAAGRLWVFAGVVWSLAAVAAVLTVSARPEGALLAALLAAGGASAHSQPMRRLFMRHEASKEALTDLFHSLTGEVVCMALIVLGAMVVVHVVRGMLYLVVPGWLRFGGPAEAGGEVEEGNRTPLGPLELLVGFGGAAILRRLVGKATGEAAGKATGEAADRKGPVDAKGTLVAAAAAFALTLLFGLVLLEVTLYSTDRGQILFALGVSFFVAATAASYFFPAGFSAPCWLAPIVLAAGLYLRAGSAPAEGMLAWIQFQPSPHVHALPVDWLSAGCGGAVGGYWLSCRLHATRRITKSIEQSAERG